MDKKYVISKGAVEKLGVNIVTLRDWDKKGKIEAIRTAENHRLYNVEKYLKEEKIREDTDSEDNNADERKKNMLRESINKWSKR